MSTTRTKGSKTPTDDPLVAVSVHPGKRPRIDERLEDGRKRPVAVIVVVGDGTAGKLKWILNSPWFRELSVRGAV